MLLVFICNLLQSRNEGFLRQMIVSLSIWKLSDLFENLEFWEME